MIVCAAFLFAALFALACLSFAYPLTYCDSIGWAPNYIGWLVHHPPSPGTSPRGWLVPAYFDGLGWLAIHLRVSNLVGLAQAAAMLAALLWMARPFARRVTGIAIVLLPALAFSVVRHAVYSQTILSEPLSIAVGAVAMRLIVLGPPSLAAAAWLGATAAFVAAVRLDQAYLVPLALARPLFAALDVRSRLRGVAAVATAAAVVAIGVTGIQRVVARADYPMAPVMVVAEWAGLTQPPANAVARATQNDLSRRVVAATAGKNVRTIHDGVPVANELLVGKPFPGWPAIAGLIAYDCANHPVAVVRDRLAVVADLYSTSYAAFWPDYRTKGRYYWAYAPLFSKWTPGAFDGADYSCPTFARAHRQFFRAKAIAWEGGCRALLALHDLATPYELLVLRPWMWLALPVFVALLWMRRVDPLFGWTAVVLAAHFATRAALVCADERYELTADWLLLWWATLVLTTAVAWAAERRRSRASRT